jgi:hypothetical protein
MRNVDLAARIRQAGGHPVDDAALLDDLPHRDRRSVCQRDFRCAKSG